MHVCTHTHTCMNAISVLCFGIAFLSGRDLCLFCLAFRAESAEFGGGEEECIRVTHTRSHTHMQS